MKIQDYLDAAEDLKWVKSQPQYADALADRTSYHRNPFSHYSYLLPIEGKKTISPHNHSDSACITLAEIGEIGFKRNIDIIGVTDHNLDIKFDGKRMISYSKGNWTGWLIRGMECRCRDNDAFGTLVENKLQALGKDVSSQEVQDWLSRGTLSRALSFLKIDDYNVQKLLKAEYDLMRDLLLLGYDGYIKPFRDFKETALACRNQNGLVIATSPFNTGARGLNREQLGKIIDSVDAIETFNSCSGKGRLCAYDILAEEYAEEVGKTGIFVNDAHTKREFGIAGFKVDAARFSYLDDPDYIRAIANKTNGERKPLEQRFFEDLRQVIRTEEIENEGTYIPKASLVYLDKMLTLSHKHAVLRPG